MPPSSRGAVAQLGERRVRNAEVVGSTPICSTNSFKCFRFTAWKPPHFLRRGYWPAKHNIVLAALRKGQKHFLRNAWRKAAAVIFDINQDTIPGREEYSMPPRCGAP